MSKTEIRKERVSDHDSIHLVTEQAFRDMSYAGGDEQDIVNRLRSVNALTLSLVAVLDEEVVGHIAFSPAEISNGSSPWFALGPVSVLPEYQQQGIGRALIETGLAQLREMNALGCILTGNPMYYQKFGFEVAVDNAPANEPAEFFMLKMLSSDVPDGRFSFHGAFYGEV